MLSGYNFNWNYLDNITEEFQLKPQQHFNGYGFSHVFWNENERRDHSQFGCFVEPLLYQIMDVANCDFILRARADMVTWSKEDFIHPAHTDFLFPNTAAVFYVNESDGDTIFYNVKPTDVANYKDLKEYDRVSPKANRLVLFDGHLLHTGCSPTKHKNRILINSNYIKEKERKKIAEGHYEA